MPPRRAQSAPRIRQDSRPENTAESSVERTEKEQSAYQKALEALLAEQQKAAEAALAEQEKAAKAAVTESEKFLASWQQKIAQSNASKAALETRKSVLSTLTAQQERRLKAETDRLSSLKDLVARVGTGGRGGERIKATYLRIRKLRREPKKIFGPPVAEELELHRARRFELDELILTLAETWGQEFDQAVATVPTEGRPVFEAAATKLRDNYRKALLEEHTVLGEVISDENKLQNLGVDLSGAIEHLEEFILPKLYWIRDSEPIGAQMFVKLRDELSRFASWGTGLFAEDAQTSLVAELKSTSFILLVIVLFVLLPPSLHVGRRVRRAVSREATSERKARASVFAVASSAILPFYLVVAAVVLRATDLPGSVGVVLSKLLSHIALILFLWLLNRSFFRAGGVAESKYGMRQQTAQALSRSVNLVLLAYLLWLLPWAILKDPPFRYDALPRVGYTLFSITALVPLFLLMRKSSPLIQDLQGPGKPSKLFENWTTISGAVVVVFVGTVVMDVLGLHFGAFKIATATFLSLVTVGALVALYRILVPVSARILKSGTRIGKKAKNRILIEATYSSLIV